MTLKKREFTPESGSVDTYADLVPIWRDRGINKRSLVWTVLTYGAEGWTLTKADEKESNHQNCGSTIECYESVGLNTEQTKVFSQSLTPPDSVYRLCYASQTLFF